MLTSEQCGRANVSAAAHSPPGAVSPSLRFSRADFRRLVAAFAASLAFYASFPWLHFLPKIVADVLMLGMWSVPGLFFLGALHSSPLLQQLPERFSVLRVALITAISLGCALVALFFVIGVIVALNALAGVPLKAS